MDVSFSPDVHPAHPTSTLGVFIGGWTWVDVVDGVDGVDGVDVTFALSFCLPGGVSVCHPSTQH
ncbi:MAG: hypothetical protein H7836_09445 [Magnetococcus sp. YQC-3]